MVIMIGCQIMVYIDFIITIKDYKNGHFITIRPL